MSQTHAVAAPSPAPTAARTTPTTHQRPAASPRPAAGSEFGRVAFERAFADPGRPVHGAVRASVEAATGVPLANVRLHTGPRVRTAARAARAAAFTLGRDIGIAVEPGQAVPDALLAHELIHAAQQAGDGDAAPADAEAQAHHGAHDLHALGPLRRTGMPYVAFAAEDWLHSTPDIRHYSFTELVDELRAVDEWLNRQVVGSQETDRMMEAKAALEAEIGRRRAAIRAADRPPPRRGRGRAAPAQPQPELPEQTEMPRVLRERTSTQLTDPTEIRAEVDRITAWLQRPDLSRADRSILRQELASLEPGFGAELGRASAQRQQQRLARALSPGDGADEAAVLANIRLIESIRPYQEQPGMAYVMHDGELLVFPQQLADRVRAEVTAALQEAARRTRSINDSTEYRMNEHLRLNYEDQYVVGFFVSLVSGEEPVDLQRRMLGPLADSNIALSRYRAAQQRGSLSEMADAVFTAAVKADQAQTIVLNGIDRAVAAAGAIVTGLTITRNLAFAVALSIGAILAAPVVAAGVAGTGATGLLATGMTAVGTGTVVGGEGFLLGFAGGAGGELFAGHGGQAALRTGLSEGRRVGEQGFAIGVGGGASLGLARNLGVGAAGLTRGGQLWRGALAGGGGNALGSMTGAALSDVPEGESRAGFVLRSGAWGAGLGMFGGAAGAGSQWLTSPAARLGVGVGLPSLAGAGATYLQTGGDWSQTLQAGALGLTVGTLASRQPTGVTPGQQRAFELGRGLMRTTRTYAGALMIGLGNVGPSVRMSESSAPTTIVVRDSDAGAVQQSQAPVQQQSPAPVQQQVSATASQQMTVPAPAQQPQPTVTVRISTGAFLVNPARLVTDPFSGQVLGQRSASAQTARSLITGIRADEGEAAAWRQALARGEIGLQGPTGSNVPGGDFYTGEIDANGQVTLIATDVKLSTVGSFPTPATTIKPTWMAELQAAIAPGRLNLGDPALEAAIRAAFAAGRVRIRQLNADYSPTGGGTITGW
ncbi:eCIS core domain-containing protein [Micromonospora sp. NPDC003776]